MKKQFKGEVNKKFYFEMLFYIIPMIILGLTQLKLTHTIILTLWKYPLVALVISIVELGTVISFTLLYVDLINFYREKYE